MMEQNIMAFRNCLKHWKIPVGMIAV
jgi:hypothetical protein